MQLVEENIIAFVKFSLRVVSGEFPSGYWEKVVKIRFPQLFNSFKEWLYHLESNTDLKKQLISLIAENIVEKIHNLSEMKNPHIPSSGIILDIGSGYLNASGELVYQALRNKNLLVYLIDNAELPYKITKRVLEILGNPPNIKMLNISAEKLPFNNNSVDAIMLLYTLHELSKTIHYIELFHNIENLRVNKESLKKAYFELIPFFDEFYRVLKNNGRLIIFDKIIDAYNIDFAMQLTSQFHVIEEKTEEKKFYLFLKK